MQEQRKYPRLNALTDIVYKKKRSNKAIQLALSKNISAGGICLIAYEPLKVGDLLEVKVYLNNYAEVVPVTGRVAWVKEFVLGSDKSQKRFDAGIEFVDMSPDNQEKIKQYINTLSIK